MNCQEFESVSVELARGSLLDAAARDSAQAHTAACAPCAARLRRERALSSALREVGASMREREAPARVEAALLAALRERRNAATTVEGVALASAQTDVRRDVAVVHLAPRFRRALFTAAVAASLLIVAVVAWRALALKETRSDDEVAQSKQVGIDSSRQSVEQASSQGDSVAHDAAKDRVTKDQTTEKVAALLRSGMRGYQVVSSPLRRRVGAQVEALPISFREDGGRVTPDDAALSSQTISAGASELAASADFVQLIVPDNAAPLDSGQMVRVDVPRAALAALGLPVNASRTGANVRADVLLAHDGTARAIRLLP